MMLPEEAKIVREMFEWAANGWSTIRISKHLQAQYRAGGDRCYSLSWVPILPRTHPRHQARGSRGSEDVDVLAEPNFAALGKRDAQAFVADDRRVEHDEMR